MEVSNSRAVTDEIKKRRDKMKCPNCESEKVKEVNGKLECECGFVWYEYDTECWRIYFEEVREC